MKSRIRHTSYVIDFLGEGFDTQNISLLLKTETDRILQSFSFSDLDDWEIDFKAIYTKKDSVRVYRRSKSYTKDKYKEVTIHIPIPLKSVVPWGVELSQHIQLGRNEHFEKYADRIEIDPTEFDDRTGYILSCMRKGIKKCFELGFTVNGCKIKL